MIKLKGFTVLELTVVMALTAIISGICYSGYQMSVKQLTGYRNASKVVDRYISLDHILSNDIHASVSMNRVNQATVYLDNGLEQIYYTFKMDYILREKGIQRDTFLLPVSGVTMKFMNEEQYIPEGPVDWLEFNVTKGEGTLTYGYEKTYGVKELMELLNVGN